MGKPRRSRRPDAPGATAKARPRAAGGAWLPFAQAALLLALALYAYAPALHGGFVFDDKALLSENALLREPDALRRFWLTTQPYDYWPLTATTFWLEMRLWGLDPHGYHVTNLVLHGAECLLLWA